MPLKKGRFSQFETEYIKTHYLIDSDSKIAEFLNRDADSIKRKRDLMGLKKARGRPSVAEQDKIRLLKPDIQLDREIYSKLSSAEKKNLFRAKFEQTERHRLLEQILTDDEVEYYAERFLDYVFQFETLLTTEEDTLHLAIMELVRAHRIGRRQKEIRDLLNEGENPIGANLDILDRQYKDCVDTFDKLMKNLNATRAQRLSQDKEAKFTLVTIVQALQEQEVKEKVGREAALIQGAAQLAANDMRTKHYLWD